MACDYIALAAPGVQKLTPYVPGKPVDELERELGISNINSKFLEYCIYIRIITS